ncbi:histidine phosphatase family protein [Nocardiopsis sp. NPDC060348]
MGCRTAEGSRTRWAGPRTRTQEPEPGTAAGDRTAHTPDPRRGRARDPSPVPGPPRRGRPPPGDPHRAGPPPGRPARPKTARGGCGGPLYHGPLPRTAQTARLAAEQLGTEPVAAPEAGDYTPHLPTRAQIPPRYADTVLDFVDSLPEHERLPGPGLARRALERFTGPARGDRELREAVITHAHPIGWLLCTALGAPAWRWVTLAPDNAALTVLRYDTDRPATVLAFNDTSHLA